MIFDCLSLILQSSAHQQPANTASPLEWFVQWWSVFGTCLGVLCANYHYRISKVRQELFIRYIYIPVKQIYSPCLLDVFQTTNFIICAHNELTQKNLFATKWQIQSWIYKYRWTSCNSFVYARLKKHFMGVVWCTLHSCLWRWSLQKSPKAIKNIFFYCVTLKESCQKEH